MKVLDNSMGNNKFSLFNALEDKSYISDPREEPCYGMNEAIAKLRISLPPLDCEAKNGSPSGSQQTYPVSSKQLFEVQLEPPPCAVTWSTMWIVHCSKTELESP